MTKVYGTEEGYAEGYGKQAEELRAQLAAIVELSDDAIIGKTLEGVITSWNPGAERIYGYRAEEVVGKPINILLPPDRPNEVAKILETIRAGGTVDHFETVRITKDGRRLNVSVTISPIKDSSGNIVGASAIARDITERKLMGWRLRHQALHDALTGLPNRQLFMDRLQHALLRAKRRRGRKVAVLFLDLDNFRLVNNSLGHEAGDHLLVALSERLRGCLRPEYTLARFGGDEFTMLIEDVKKPVDAVRAAERLVKCLQQPFTLDGREFVVTASIGIALGTAHTKSAEQLLREADAAMYQAKEDSLVNYEIFDSIRHEQTLGRLELEHDLRRALENEELRVYYQPEFRPGQPNSIAGIEALVRWEHPQKGLILPKEFISIAEETGLIVPLGRWVLEEACRQAKEWQKRYPSEPSLAVYVNVSAEQVRQTNLTREVASALRESEVKPGSLVLEITEATLLKETQLSDAALRELKALGVRLAIDDFGKEYSSLSYLKRLPADSLKLDRSFLDDLGENQNNITIAQMVISLAQSLELEVTAEGVETAEQLECLKEMGCDLVQGYYLAKPLPSEEVERILAATG